MDVYAYDAYCPAAAIESDGVKPVSSQDELFEKCEVVSLHIPATAETRQSINYALVGKMPKGGVLVNTARKEVINEPELLKLMQERADLKYVTDIMPEADADFRILEGRYFSTPKRWVHKQPRPISMPEWLRRIRLPHSSRTDVRNIR